jgi:hypothetical protein
LLAARESRRKIALVEEDDLAAVVADVGRSSATGSSAPTITAPQRCCSTMERS